MRPPVAYAIGGFLDHVVVIDTERAVSRRWASTPGRPDAWSTATDERLADRGVLRGPDLPLATLNTEDIADFAKQDGLVSSASIASAPGGGRGLQSSEDRANTPGCSVAGRSRMRELMGMSMDPTARAGIGLQLGAWDTTTPPSVEV